MTTDKFDESGTGTSMCRPSEDTGRGDSRKQDTAADCTNSAICRSAEHIADCANEETPAKEIAEKSAGESAKDTTEKTAKEMAEKPLKESAREIAEKSVKGSAKAPLVLPGERVDDLQRAGLRIIQDPDRFCFGMDAVLLAAYVQMKKAKRGLDLGTGNGIIPILLSDRTDCASLTGLEIQPASADLAARSVALNGLEDRIGIVQGDIREADRIFAAASFDFITCNPPYRQAGSGRISGTPAGGGHKQGRHKQGAHKQPENDQKTKDATCGMDPRAIARHELLCTFEDVARAAATLLRPGGHFYLVHRPLRLAEIITKLCTTGLEPKRMRLVYPHADKAPNMVLLDCVRGGAPELRVEPPLIVYEKDGSYTPELLAVYYGK